jgi:fatty acid desaturase
MNLAREKAALFAILGAATAVLYFGTLHSSLFPAVTVPATWLDRAMPFSPWFVAPYASFFFLILLPLFVVRDRAELRETAYGYGLIVLLSSVIFLFWPTRIGLTGSLIALDVNRNACPSLHASLAVYCTLCAQRHVQSLRARYGLSLWMGLVLLSPIVIRQHVAIDIAAGALLGGFVYAVVFRPTRVEAPDTEPVNETRRIRTSLARQAPEQFAPLTRHDGRKRIHELAAFVGLAAMGVAIGIRAQAIASAPLLIAGILLTAVALNTFPLLMHEGMHGVLFPNRRWNWLVSVLLGSAFLMSFSAYRVLHLRHHRYLGGPRDPDDYHNYSRSLPMVWFLHFVRLTAGPLLYLVLIPALALKYGSAGQRKLICLEYTMLLAAYSLLLRLFPARELLLTWAVPLLIMGLFTAIRGFTQHGITEAADPYLASRTMLPNPVVAFFLLNENYHLEHHLFPEIPSYHLPQLHRLIWPKLPRAVSGRSYLAFLAAFLRATPRMDETPIGLVEPQKQL